MLSSCTVQSVKGVRVTSERQNSGRVKSEQDYCLKPVLIVFISWSSMKTIKQNMKSFGTKEKSWSNKWRGILKDVHIVSSLKLNPKEFYSYDRKKQVITKSIGPLNLQNYEQLSKWLKYWVNNLSPALQWKTQMVLTKRPQIQEA